MNSSLGNFSLEKSLWNFSFEFKFMEFRLGILDWNSSLGILIWNSRIPKLAQSFGVCASAVKIRLQDFIAIFALRAAALAMERRSGSVRRNFTIAFGALANKSK